MANPKLFISFAGTMHALKSGRVAVGDLDTGLFVFGCTRDHALTPGASGEFVEDIVTKRPDLHEQLVSAVLKAESDGRVRWRSPEQSNVSFELVDELLVANGHDPLVSHEEVYGADTLRLGYDYCYGAVEDRCVGLEVIAWG